jgi:hypothetical protein
VLTWHTHNIECAAPTHQSVYGFARGLPKVEPTLQMIILKCAIISTPLLIKIYIWTGSLLSADEARPTDNFAVKAEAFLWRQGDRPLPLVQFPLVQFLIIGV